MLPAAQLTPYFTVERAHRVPPQRGLVGSLPRTMILRLLNFRDRDELLRAARAVWEISYQNAKPLLFPDYTVETQKMRRSFDAVKAAMRSKSIKYSILFPAKLRVVDNEVVRLFTNPREAASWLESLPSLKMRRPGFFPICLLLSPTGSLSTALDDEDSVTCLLGGPGEPWRVGFVS